MQTMMARLAEELHKQHKSEILGRLSQLSDEEMKQLFREYGIESTLPKNPYDIEDHDLITGLRLHA